jgi:hypothetical protein
MTTELFMFAEEKIDGKWTAADYAASGNQEFPGGSVSFVPVFTNYDLFAILANVGNPPWHMRIFRGAGFRPIANPRGLPRDVSEEVGSVAKSIKRGNCHSYLTLEELLKHNWEQTATKVAYVPPEDFEALQQGRGKPRCNSEKPENRDWKLARWNLKHREAAGQLLYHILPRLREIGSPEEVRVVFWFVG